MQLTFTPPSKQPTSQCLSLSLRVSNQSPLFPEAQFSHIRLFKVLLKAHSEHVGREGQASLSYLHGGSRRGGIHSQQINTSSKNALFLISEFHTCILLSRMKHTEVVRLILLSSLPTTLRQHTLKKKICMVVWCSFWNLVFLLCLCVHATSLQSCLILFNTMDSIDGQAKNTGVGCHFFLQEIFPTQGSNLCLLHCRWNFYCWATR